MNTDGWVIIGADLDTKELEKGLRHALSEVKSYEKEAEKLTEQKAKAEVDLQPYREEIGILQEQINEHQRLKQSTEEKIANERYYQRALDMINFKYKDQIEKYETINNKIKENTVKQGILNGKIDEFREKLNRAKGFDYVKESIGNISNSMNGIINKVIRWGLAVFGIRGAYMAIRRAISIVSAENEGVANSFEQIRKVIAGALLPVVQTVINWIVKLMVYVNYLWKVLTGKALFNFADATKKSSKELKKASGSSGKIAKDLKDARKQLAAFDEMNILSDNVASSGGGGGGAGGIGDTDFPNIFDKLKKITIPKWLEDLGKLLKTIKEYWKELLPVAAAFAGILLAMKIAPFIHAITGATTALAQFKVGLALAVAGAVLLIGEIVNMMLNWDNMTAKQKVLSVALALLGAAFVALGYAIATGISVATLGIGALIAAVVAVVGVVVGYIAKLATEEKAIKSVKKAQEDLTAAKKRARDAENEYVQAVDDVNEKHKELIRLQKETGISGKDLYDKVQKGTLDYKDMNGQQKEVYKAYLAEIGAQEKLKSTTNELAKAKENEKMKTWEKKLAVDAESGSYDGYKKSVVDAYKNGELSADQAAKLISKSMTGMSKDSEKTFTKDIPDDIKKGIDPDKYRTKWERFKSDWKKNVAKLSGKVTLNLVLLGVPAAMEAIARVTAKAKGKKSAKGAIVKIPKLAIGGVVNQPGRGVPLGGAITGERGAEGVIPLTDSQQMALLGEAIGRYITVNTSITNTMNGRVISRELKKVQNEENFAFNR